MLQLKRNIKAIFKYKTSSGLTLLSMVISFLGVIILTLYVSFEKSFDHFHKSASSIYRLETKEYGSNLPALLGNLISEKVPEVEKLTVLLFDNARISTPGLRETSINFQSSLLYAGSTFFDLFTFPLTLGNPETALTDPNTVVLTETLSEKLFGGANPLGETIFLNEEGYKVTGVMSDFPENSSFNADCIPSFTTLTKHNRSGVNEWSEWSFHIFMNLRK